MLLSRKERYNVHDAKTFYINFSIIRFFCCLVVSLTHLSDMKELLALYVKLLHNRCIVVIVELGDGKGEVRR